MIGGLLKTPAEDDLRYSQARLAAKAARRRLAVGVDRRNPDGSRFPKPGLDARSGQPGSC